MCRPLQLGVQKARGEGGADGETLLLPSAFVLSNFSKIPWLRCCSCMKDHGTGLLGPPTN